MRARGNDYSKYSSTYISPNTPQETAFVLTQAVHLKNICLKSGVHNLVDNHMCSQPISLKQLFSWVCKCTRLATCLFKRAGRMFLM